MNMVMHTKQGRLPGQDAALKHLALDSPVPIDVLEEIYEIERTKLEDGARILIFIRVCALRHVREVLRQSRVKNHLPRGPSRK